MLVKNSRLFHVPFTGKIVLIKSVESFVADFKAHPFIKKVFALSQGTRADYLGEECIVLRGRAFTTSCLRNFRLGRHPYHMALVGTGHIDEETTYQILLKNRADFFSHRLNHSWHLESVYSLSV